MPIAKALLPGSSLHDHAYAVIDIGSNSVRMVVYHGLARIPVPLFNEKYYCGLGQGIAETGRLNRKAVRYAQDAIGRFVVMARRLQVAQLTIMATAAIRQAEDGAAFVQDIMQRHHVDVHVLPGTEEARLAALGVVASFHRPCGLTLDLGGGSLELASVNGATIRHQCSLDMGAIRLLDESGGEPPAMQAIIRAHLSQVEWLAHEVPPCIYAVGGSFRTIAKMHMKRAHYPLPILHEYTISASAIHRMAQHIRHMSVEEIAALPGIASNRAQTVLPALLTLQYILRRSKAVQVVFSVGGIREGLIFDQLSPRAQREDPLLASANDLASLAGRKGRYAKELFAWMHPLFEGESESEHRLRMALCTLSELAWTIDPNFRAQWAYLRVIQSAIKGVSHKERIMLGLALYHRYQQKWKGTSPEISLLSNRDMAWARYVGIAANLAFHVSGGKAGNLYHARLLRSRQKISLQLDEEANPLRTETVEKRLEGLGSAFRAFASFDK